MNEYSIWALGFLGIVGLAIWALRAKNKHVEDATATEEWAEEQRRQAEAWHAERAREQRKLEGRRAAKPADLSALPRTPLNLSANRPADPCPRRWGHKVLPPDPVQQARNHPLDTYQPYNEDLDGPRSETRRKEERSDFDDVADVIKVGVGIASLFSSDDKPSSSSSSYEAPSSPEPDSDFKGGGGTFGGGGASGDW
jgi:uncharacterized membrane protein YgcG